MTYVREKFCLKYFLEISINQSFPRYIHWINCRSEENSNILKANLTANFMLEARVKV